MTQEEMLTALYEKMAAEQDKYRDWLKNQPAAEVLNHAYEYTVREDIVMCMEELELTEAQAKALLASPAPLADVYKDFEKLETSYMDVIRDTIETRANELYQAQETLKNTPLYPHSAAYASEHGEMAQYNASFQANLDIIRRILGLPKSAVEDALDLVGLTEFGDRLAKKYSLGMKQRLGLAGALLGRPPILILDEPTNGLDPSGIHEIRNLVKSLPDLYDCTILISSHMLSEIELIADDIGILNHGRLLFEGSLDELRQSALRAGFAADNLEDMFLSMVEKDNAARKQRAQL